MANSGPDRCLDAVVSFCIFTERVIARSHCIDEIVKASKVEQILKTRSSISRIFPNKILLIPWIKQTCKHLAVMHIYRGQGVESNETVFFIYADAVLVDVMIDAILINPRASRSFCCSRSGV